MLIEPKVSDSSTGEPKSDDTLISISRELDSLKEPLRSPEAVTFKLCKLYVIVAPVLRNDLTFLHY